MSDIQIAPKNTFPIQFEELMSHEIKIHTFTQKNNQSNITCIQTPEYTILTATYATDYIFKDNFNYTIDALVMGLRNLSNIRTKERRDDNVRTVIFYTSTTPEQIKVAQTLCNIYKD